MFLSLRPEQVLNGFTETPTAAGRLATLSIMLSPGGLAAMRMAPTIALTPPQGTRSGAAP